MPRGFLAVALLLAACRTSGPDGRPQSATPITPEPACTLDTPLDPAAPGSPGHLIPSDLNPNGMSELAILMRSMLADMQQARQDVGVGQAPTSELTPRHLRIRCSWPTRPKDRNARFDAQAQAYLAAVGQLDREKQDRKTAYNNTVQACLACHDQMCPGPVDLINTLKLP